MMNCIDKYRERSRVFRYVIAWSCLIEFFENSRRKVVLLHHSVINDRSQCLSKAA